MFIQDLEKRIINLNLVLYMIPTSVEESYNTETNEIEKKIKVRFKMMDTTFDSTFTFDVFDEIIAEKVENDNVFISVS